MVSRKEAPAGRATELVTLLDDQRRIVRELLALSHRQRDAIERDDPTEILRLLADRDHLLHAVDTNTQAIEEIRSLDDPVASADEPTRLLLQARLKELADLAGEIMERDRADVVSATAVRDRVAEELANVNKGRRITGAYGAAGAASGATLHDQEG